MECLSWNWIAPVRRYLKCSSKWYANEPERRRQSGVWRVIRASGTIWACVLVPEHVPSGKRDTDMKHVIASPIRHAHAAERAFSAFLTAYQQQRDRPGVCDFALGNPHEMPIPEYAATLKRWTEPRHKDWFGYTLNHRGAQRAVADSLVQRMQMPFEPEDIAMTHGAFGGLAVALRLLAGPGDEVVYISPPWFEYESMILATGATPRRVRVHAQTLDLDLAAIEREIGEHTRCVIVNSPHNPTGKVYTPATLEKLASLLEAASKRQGRPIYLISDESYNRIVFDGCVFTSPASLYPYTLIIYTYGKTLLTPGERVGYIALPPTMPRREMLLDAIGTTQLVSGWIFPNAVLQYALPELERLSIDMAQLQCKRDRMVAGLREAGYTLHVPDGTFYVLVHSPETDDQRFVERLAQDNVLVLPGHIVDMPGCFRVSLTANEDMIERALPVFSAVRRDVTSST